MVSKEDKKRRQELVKAAEKKELAKEISKMPISALHLKALLKFLDSPDFVHCDHSLKETVNFLDKHNLDKSKIIPWLNEYGGYCDCEVVFNVGDAWGEYVGVTYDNDDFQEVTKKKKGQKQEILSLTCGLRLPSVPKPWKLFCGDGDEGPYWYMEFGKKGNLGLTIIEKPLPKGDHESDEYWIQQWTQLTNLSSKTPFVVEKEQAFLSNVTLKSVTVSSPGWTPVYRWIYNPDNGNWYIQAKTDLSRKQSDFRELSNLLGKIELT